MGWMGYEDPTVLVKLPQQWCGQHHSEVVRGKPCSPGTPVGHPPQLQGWGACSPSLPSQSLFKPTSPSDRAANRHQALREAIFRIHLFFLISSLDSIFSHPQIDPTWAAREAARLQTAGATLPRPGPCLWRSEAPPCSAHHPPRSLGIVLSSSPGPRGLMASGQLCPRVAVLSLFYSSQEDTVRCGGVPLS